MSSLEAPWRMAFRFRKTDDLDDFLKWAIGQMGEFDEDEMVINRKTKSVIFTIDLIEPFAVMAKRATFHYPMHSIRLNKYQPKDKRKLNGQRDQG